MGDDELLPLWKLLKHTVNETRPLGHNSLISTDDS